MIVYHGTSLKNANFFASRGIRPRFESPGNWMTNVPAHNEAVYLAKTIFSAEFYAFRSCLVDNTTTGAIVSIDLDKVNKDLLRVDENFLDIEERGTFEKGPIELRKQQRGLIRGDSRWEQSLERAGLCSYFGVIPPAAVGIISTKKLEELVGYHPQILGEKTPERRCYLFDIFIGEFHWATNVNKWITKDHKQIVTEETKVIVNLDKYIKHCLEDDVGT